jgi:hypothetical protein
MFNVIFCSEPRCPPWTWRAPVYLPHSQRLIPNRRIPSVCSHLSATDCEPFSSPLLKTEEANACLILTAKCQTIFADHFNGLAWWSPDLTEHNCKKNLNDKFNPIVPEVGCQNCE